MTSPNLCFDQPTINPRGALARKLYTATGLNAYKLRQRRIRTRPARNTVHYQAVIQSNKLDLSSLVFWSNRYGLSDTRIAKAISYCGYSDRRKDRFSFLVFDNGNKRVDARDVFFVVDRYENIAGGRLGDSSVTVEPNGSRNARTRTALRLGILRAAAQQFVRRMKQKHFSASFQNLQSYLSRLERRWINRRRR